MKSTLVNMVAVLFGVTLIASLGVGIVYRITAEPIAAANAAAVTEALARVLPPFETTKVDTLQIDELPITVYTACDASGEVAGYAVQTATKSGFGGMIRMMVGFDPEGTVLNINVLEQAETPGLGTKMADEENVLLSSICGRRPETMQLVEGRIAVRKDGGDVDALTAATISSRAYCDAVNRAWMAYRSVVTGTAPTDVATGASMASTPNSTAESLVSSDAATGATATQYESSDAASDTSAAATSYGGASSVTTRTATATSNAATGATSAGQHADTTAATESTKHTSDVASGAPFSAVESSDVSNGATVSAAEQPSAGQGPRQNGVRQNHRQNTIVHDAAETDNMTKGGAYEE